MQEFWPMQEFCPSSSMVRERLPQQTRRCGFPGTGASKVRLMLSFECLEMLRQLGYRDRERGVKNRARWNPPASCDSSDSWLLCPVRACSQHKTQLGIDVLMLILQTLPSSPSAIKPHQASSCFSVPQIQPSSRSGTHCLSGPFFKHKECTDLQHEQRGNRAWVMAEMWP